MTEIECPYCEADCGVPEDPSGEGEWDQEECPKCEKSFVYYPEYSIDFYSQKAPCLNGGEHTWEPICGAPKEYFKDKFRCKNCNKEEHRKPDSK